MSISTTYISAAANRFSQTADVSSASLVAFGSSRLIGLWSVTREPDTSVHKTLSGHQGIVTCVRFASEQTLVSADDKGTIICWKKVDAKWKITFTMQAHSSSISSLSIFEDCLVTGSSDTSVKVWRMESDNLVLVQAIPHGKTYPLALALARLPGSKTVILATSGTDRKVNLWLRSSGDSFLHSTSLAGHEDWVKSLAFRSPSAENQPLILASASQDATIRLWRIDKLINERSQSTATDGELDDELLDSFEASLADIGDAEEGGRQISLKRHILTVKADFGSAQLFSVTFDALLMGHEAGVTCLSWQPTRNSESTPTLLSSSTDSSVIMWSPSTILTRTNDTSNAIWINRERFGDVGGQRLGGFVGTLWAQNGTEALAWGWAGGWRRWRRRDSATDEREETWEENGAISGHNGPVKGLSWSPNGEYLISTGIDQTSRIHAPLVHEGNGAQWHELGRPQVHGYDLLDAVFVNPLKFVSIADEKVARVFVAPRSFVDSLENLHVARFSEEEHRRPIAANVPPLGLSNKAVADSVTEGSVDCLRRPFEGELAAITLWPEVEKVFGHGYELITLAISQSRRVLATACKASTSEHAVVRLYDTDEFRPLGKTLSGHSLTVTRIAFSPDDRYILSVSRDRSWRLYESHEDGDYSPVAADLKSHARIIWDCAWSSEGDIFATASRDKTVKIWKIPDGATSHWTCVATIKTNSGATAVSFTGRGPDGRRKLAIGLETGEILVYLNGEGRTGWRLIASESMHVDQVHRLAWRPSEGGISTELGSCSEDGTLRVLNCIVD